MLTTLALSLALAGPPSLANFASGWTVRLYARLPPAERRYPIVLNYPQPGESVLFGFTYEPDGDQPTAATLTLAGRRVLVTTQNDRFCHILTGRVTRRGLRGRGRRYDATCTVPQRPHGIQWEARR